MNEAEQAMRELPTGGRTPLAHALTLAGEMIEQIRRSQPDAPVLFVLLSDGKANVTLPETEGDPWQQALQAAQRIADMSASCLVLDSEAGFVQTGRARELAQALAAEYQVLARNYSNAGTTAYVSPTR
jgi:magnesium chelatase subunit D